MPIVATAAICGALGALIVTYLLSRRRGVLDPVLLVLTGVAVGIVCGAGIMLLRQSLPFQYTAAADRLLIGGIRDDTTPTEMWTIGTLTTLGAITCWWLGPSMDLASLGEDEAISLGVRLGRLRFWMFLWAGILTACSIMLAGTSKGLAAMRAFSTAPRADLSNGLIRINRTSGVLMPAMSRRRVGAP